MQELIWAVRPDVIVETGIAHGCSLALSASMLALLDLCDATEEGDVVVPRCRVVGVDIDIRAHIRAAIEAHPLVGRILMIQGSSIDPAIIAKVRDAVGDAARVLVSLDRNHTPMTMFWPSSRLYAPMISKGNYCVVFETVIHDMPAEMFPDRNLGSWLQPQDSGIKIPREPSGIRDRQGHLPQAVDLGRAGWVSEAGRLMINAQIGQYNSASGRC